MKNKQTESNTEKDNSNYHEHRKLKELQQIYDTSSQQKKLKCLFYGDWGTWKTTLAATMPRPILMQTFDPGGDKVFHIQEGVKDGSIIVDKRFQEREFMDSESRFREWNEDYQKMKNEGTFDQIGTYVLDSLTTFQRFVIDASIDGNTKNRQISRNMPVKTPQMRDYNVQGAAMEYAVSDMLELPCHVMVIAHAEEDTDDDSGIRFFQPLITGKKLRKQLPLLFDEIYIAMEKRKGVDVLTSPKNYYKARSRISKFSPKIKDAYEVRDPKDFSFSRDIMQHAGYCSPEEVVTLEDFPT